MFCYCRNCSSATSWSRRFVSLPEVARRQTHAASLTYWPWTLISSHRNRAVATPAPHTVAKTRNFLHRRSLLSSFAGPVMSFVSSHSSGKCVRHRSRCGLTFECDQSHSLARPPMRGLDATSSRDRCQKFSNFFRWRWITALSSKLSSRGYLSRYRTASSAPATAARRYLELEKEQDRPQIVRRDGDFTALDTNHLAEGALHCLGDLTLGSPFASLAAHSAGLYRAKTCRTQGELGFPGSR